MSGQSGPVGQFLSPQQLADFNRRANVLAAGESSTQLERSCRDLVRDYPGKALGHFLLGRCLFELERLPEAFPHIETAHRLEPANANYAYYLGLAFTTMNLPDRALPLLRTAYEKGGPNVALYAETLSECYFQMGRSELAIPAATKALSLSKTIEDELRCRELLCRVLFRANQAEQARPHITRLASSGPRYTVQAATFEARISKEGASSAVGEKLRSFLRDSKLNTENRSEVLLALGRLHERDKNYSEAFSCWQKSREIALAHAPPERDHGTYLASMKRLYANSLFDLNVGNPSREPVFIVGMPRSGTTLTEQIIGSHPDAVAVGELTNITSLARYVQNEVKSGDGNELLIQALNKGEFRRVADEILQFLKAMAGRPAKRIIEKMPHNFLYVGFLALCFPNVRFIHSLRSPLDAFISSYQNNMTSFHSYSYSQETYGREYIAHIQLMDYWKSVIGDRILTVQYEKLVQSPEEWAPRIVEFAGLDWQEECLKFFEKAGTVRTFSADQVRQPIHSLSVERWRRYETQLAPLRSFLDAHGFRYPD
ncbi:tetratricopeptide repeat-containing sulfotransferase family protein [Aestuariivirga sp.]|uniref:tetratricopeptide repeat-containing sulfotransferase family protein n=1 Tax=Aestuariivirga sp. TaxID=2650926 RepID=UPI0039E43A52